MRGRGTLIVMEIFEKFLLFRVYRMHSGFAGRKHNFFSKANLRLNRKLQKKST